MAPVAGKSRPRPPFTVRDAERIADTYTHSEEPYYDDEEPQEEYYSPDAPDVEPGENGAIGDEDADNIVTSGDPSAAAKENAKSHKDKRIPNEQRTTTPYLTKYEKARILGTRALQIRYAPQPTEGIELGLISGTA